MRHRSAVNHSTSDHVYGCRHGSLRPGFTLLEAVLVFLACLLIFVVYSLFAPNYAHSGPSRRTVCSYNLKQLGTAMYTYGNENKEMWPVAPHAEAIQEG